MLKMKQINKLLFSFLLTLVCTFSFGQRLESIKLFSSHTQGYSNPVSYTHLTLPTKA